MTIENRTLLRVQGMTCGACVRHVREALGDVSGVRGVEVDLRGGTASVLHDGSASPQALAEVVRRAGYGAVVET